MNSAVYAIKNNLTNFVYIGSSKEVERRFASHARELRNSDHVNKHLQSAWNKYGEANFEFIICEYVPEDELKTREQWWINTTPNLYNNRKDVSDGRRGTINPQEIRDKISETLRGVKKTPEHVANATKARNKSLAEKGWNYAKSLPKRTAEHIFHLSQSRKGKLAGETNPSSKLDSEKVLDIKRRLSKGESGFSIAKHYAVTRRVIYQIRDGLAWTHVKENKE